MDRYALVTRNIREVVREDELRDLLGREARPRGYIGFEPSGFLHIGTGLYWTNKVNDLVDAGVHMIIYLADWHAYINDKMGGSLENIRVCGEYMKEAFRALGLRSEVEFIFSHEFVSDPAYWEKVLRVAKKTTLQRAKRAMTIMGRKESDAELDASKIIYPFMQVADIFHMDLDIAMGGMDQRHAHMLARDVAEKLGWKKVVALHGHLISGLKGGGRMDPAEAKMSKSDPDSTIYIHDTPEEIRRKIKRAYCPAGEVEGNPIMDIARIVLFPYYVDKLVIKRPEKWGGDVVYETYEDLERDFVAGELHPQDLKNAVAEELIRILAPVKEHFEKNPEPYEAMKHLTVTR